MAVGRGRIFPQTKFKERSQQNANDHAARADENWPRRVVDHEIDMDRMDRRASPLGWFIALARRLMGLEHRVVRPPRRAVERENEEAWPSRE